MKSKSELFRYQNQDLIPQLDWLADRGIDLEKVLHNGMRRAPANMPLKKLRAYERTVVLNRFLQAFVERHSSRHQPPDAASRQLLELAVVACMTPGVLRKHLPKFCRTKRVEACLGGRVTFDDFSTFVTERSNAIAGKLLSNFDLTRSSAALEYVRQVSVSQYLNRLMARIRERGGGLIAYAESNQKLARRNALAAKLAYAPSSLTVADREELARNYGWSNVTTSRQTIKLIAQRLRYTTPAALSRKLYKMNQWSKKAPQPDTDKDYERDLRAQIEWDIFDK